MIINFFITPGPISECVSLPLRQTTGHKGVHFCKVCGSYGDAPRYCQCSIISPFSIIYLAPDRVAQSVVRLTQEPEVPGSILVRPHTSVSLSDDSRRAVVSYWRSTGLRLG